MTLHRILPLAVAGPGAGLALFLVLRAVVPGGAGRVDDPWAAHFREAGLEARLRAVSRQPERHFALQRLRPRFEEEPDLAATVLKLVEVGRLSIQIAEFPTSDAAAKLFNPGTQRVSESPLFVSLSFRIRRSGRYALIVPPVHVGMGKREEPEGQLIQDLFRAFDSWAEAHP